MFILLACRLPNPHGQAGKLSKAKERRLYDIGLALHGKTGEAHGGKFAPGGIRGSDEQQNWSSHLGANGSKRAACKEVRLRFLPVCVCT